MSKPKKSKYVAELQRLGADVLREMTSPELVEWMNDIGIVISAGRIRHERKKILDAAGVRFVGQQQGIGRNW